MQKDNAWLSVINTRCELYIGDKKIKQVHKFMYSDRLQKM